MKKNKINKKNSLRVSTSKARFLFRFLFSFFFLPTIQETPTYRLLELRSGVPTCSKDLKRGRERDKKKTKKQSSERLKKKKKRNKSCCVPTWNHQGEPLRRRSSAAACLPVWTAAYSPAAGSGRWGDKTGTSAPMMLHSDSDIVMRLLIPFFFFLPPPDALHQ